MRRTWVGGIAVSLVLLIAFLPWRVPAVGGTGEYDITIQSVVIESSKDVFGAGPDGEDVDYRAVVSYTVTLPDGSQMENPCGDDLPFTVELSYDWQWITNLEDFGDRPLYELVEPTWVSDDHYSVKFLEAGHINTHVEVTAHVVPRQ